MGYVKLVKLWILLLCFKTAHCDSWVFAANATEPFELNSTAQSLIEEWSDYYYGYPEMCRSDICFEDITLDWYGEISWPQTYVGKTRYVNCTYTYLRHGVASRDCVLSLGDAGQLLSCWGPINVNDCPGTPVNESLRYIKSHELSPAVVDEDLAILCEGMQLTETVSLGEYANEIESVLSDSIGYYKLEMPAMQATTLESILCVADQLLERTYNAFSNVTLFYNNIMSLPEIVTGDVDMEVALKRVSFESKALLVAPTIYASHVVNFLNSSREEDGSVIASIIPTVGSRLEEARSILIAFSEPTGISAMTPSSAQEYDFIADPGDNDYDTGPDGSFSSGKIWAAEGLMVYQAFRLDDDLRVASSIHLELPVPDQVDSPYGLCKGVSVPLVPTDYALEFDANTCKCAPDLLRQINVCTCHPPEIVLLVQFYQESGDRPHPFAGREGHEGASFTQFLRFPYNKELAIVEEVLRAISLVCLLLTVLSYAIFRKTRRGTVTTILIHLCISIIAVIIIFYISDNVANTVRGCIAANVLRTYFVLVSLMWNGVEAFNMYLRLIKVFDSKVEKFTIKASLIAWGVPLTPIIIAFAVDTHAFDGQFVVCDFLCSPKEMTLYLAFLLPMCLIIVHNLVIFALVMRQISGRQISIQKDQRRNRIIQLIGALTMLALLGVPWIFSVFGVIDGNLSRELAILEGTFQTIFVVLMNSQGIFIFLFHCARIPEVRSQWRSSVSKITSTMSLVSETPAGESMAEKPKDHKGKGTKTESTDTSKQKTDTSDVL